MLKNWFNNLTGRTPGNFIDPLAHQMVDQEVAYRKQLADYQQQINKHYAHPQFPQITTTGTGSVPWPWNLPDTLDTKLQKVFDTAPVDLASYVMQAKAHLIRAVKELDVAIIGFQDSPATVGSFTSMVNRMKALQGQLMKAAEFGMEEGKK